MGRVVHFTIILFATGCLTACEAREATAGGPAPNQAAAQSGADTPKEASQASSSEPADLSDYTWLEATQDKDLVSLESRFPVPEGYERVDVEADSFAAFLRHIPVYRHKTSVEAYDGRTIRAPSAAVVALDVGDRNLQQCADTAIRLHAEYLWSHGRKDEIAYHFTSGDRSSWSDWSRGERFRIRGAEVQRTRSGRRADDRNAFRSYLEHLFMYAGTRSLRYDSTPAQSLSPGTFFVAPGSPGHAVIVLDVAENADGERIALLGQGFMPAQELHVLEGTAEHALDSVWWRLPGESGKLDTPSWRAFSRDDARRFTTTSQ